MKDEVLLNENQDYWTFPSYRNKGINSIADYPAMMVDVMQEELIGAVLSNSKKHKTLLDPFYGAGTSLIIAQKKGLTPIGIDINPLAYLITYVKLYDYDVNQVISAVDRLVQNIEDTDDFEIISFHNIDKWFRKDIIAALSKVRSCISLEPDLQIRRFFWVAFARIVRRYSNSRSSTFKLHIKKDDVIARMENNVIADFINIIQSNTGKIAVDYEKKDFSLFCGDSLLELDRIPDESVDIICTSPPYGDNGTTITYGQFSSLQLRWIDNKDLDGFSCGETYSSIDSSSLGGKSRSGTTNSKAINAYLDTISKKKRNKIVSFINDYEIVFNKMCRKLKRNGSLLLTIGNRKVDNRLVPFDSANIEFATMNKLKLEKRLTRKIVNKRMAAKVSHLTNIGSVESMKEETILVFRKG